MRFARFVTLLFILVVTCGVCLPSLAEASAGSLRGVVTDPSGAIVVQATVTAKSATGQTFTATSNRQGVYEFKGVPAGKYTVTATSKGFNVYELNDVDVPAAETQTLDIQFGIAVEKEQVTVEDQSTNVEVAPSNNASSIVIKGKELEGLSDDPDELQQDLQALAGPSAGPNGGQIYIDGFANGQLPPKSAIREIRVNQNPFSAQYDRLGYGRVEVFTKPGADKFHGQIMFNANHSILNSKSPFAKNQPDYRTDMFSGNVSGPLSKKASFSLNMERRNINDASVINATLLNPARDPLNPYTFSLPFSQAILNPHKRTNITPRLDYQLTPGNTFTVRYQYMQDDEDNNGIGQFSLASQAYNSRESSHQVQVSDTQVISPRVINETRFQFLREREQQAAIDNRPTIVVQGSFVDGGSSLGVQADHIERYELQNYTSMMLGKHFVKYGGRLRASRQVSDSTSGFNGTFTFSALSPTSTSLEAYAAGKPSQFSITTGIRSTEVQYVDAGLYAEDDWRLRPTLTLSYGVRFETQNGINAPANFAPRVGVAWGIGKGSTTPKTVLRGGFGMFYDRVGQGLILNAARMNGVAQREFTIATPTFYPNIPTIDQLALFPSTSPKIYRIDPKIAVPYTMQMAVTLERQITKTATASVTYLRSRGVHTLLARNINAPLPGTFDPDVVGSVGVRPLGGTDNIFQYESGGTFKQNQLIANTNVRLGAKLSLFSFYSLSYANSNTSGGGSVPSNSYNINDDWGRAAFDVRHRFAVGGNFTLPYRISLSPFIMANSGQPFNITAGKDLNGDSVLNDRPAYATATTPVEQLKTTPLGNFNVKPAVDQQRIPINYLTGPAQFTVNLRVSKTIGFGKEGKAPAGDNTGVPQQRGGGDHGHGPAGGRGPGGFGGGPMGGQGGFGGGGRSSSPYNLTISASARNLFNRVNLAAPVGNLSSPSFGQSISLAGGPFGSSAANRRVDLQVQFSF